METLQKPSTHFQTNGISMEVTLPEEGATS
jgi:hypothetical protein